MLMGAGITANYRLHSSHLLTQSATIMQCGNSTMAWRTVKYITSPA